MTELERRIGALASLPPASLRREWQRVLKVGAPAITPDLLRRGIAYRLQEAARGGLTKAASRELDQLLKRIARGRHSASRLRCAAEAWNPAPAHVAGQDLHRAGGRQRVHLR